MPPEVNTLTPTDIVMIVGGLLAAVMVIASGAYLIGRWDQIKYWTLRK